MYSERNECNQRYMHVSRDGLADDKRQNQWARLNSTALETMGDTARSLMMSDEDRSTLYS